MVVLVLMLVLLYKMMMMIVMNTCVRAHMHAHLAHTCILSLMMSMGVKRKPPTSCALAPATMLPATPEPSARA